MENENARAGADDTIRYRAEIPPDDHWFEQIRCQAACPVHTDARGYVQAIARGEFEQAYLIARSPNPLASVCGWICGAPCETACRRGEIDSPIRIRALKRFVTSRFGPEADGDRVEAIVTWLRRCLGGFGAAPGNGSTRPLLDPHTRGTFVKATGQRVAIVGSGPAGLAAAHDLALMGFKPVILEMEPVPAGMLAVGVPEYRLPRDLIQAEVRVIADLGVEIRCNTEVGRDVTFPELRRDFDAVVLAVGAKRSRGLDVPGADAPQVLGAVEFLREIALGRPIELGQRVIVVGGGNVAYDAGRTVIRNTETDAAKVAAGLSSVTETCICCLESRAEIPADEVEVMEGGEEGVSLRTGLGPREIHVTDGRVSGVTFVRCTRVFDDQGEFRPLFDESDRTTIVCDTVLLAIGQRVDLGFVDAERDGLELLANGVPRSDPDTLETTARNVFVAGDLAHGTKLLIHAVASGKQVARSIYRRIVGEEIGPRAVDLHLPIHDYARDYDYEGRQRIALPVVPARERTRSRKTQVELPLAEDRAMFEASRCLNCSVNTIFDSHKCILCGGCVDICPSSCLKIVDLAQLEITDEIGGLASGLASDADMAAILKDEAVCIRCGLCAARCPVAAITMEHYCREELLV